MKLVWKIVSRFVFDRKSDFENQVELHSKEKKGFVSFIGAISVAGLSLGITALLVVTSVMNGFERELTRVLTAFHGHILLFSRGEPLSNPDQYISEIKQNFADVKAVSPYIFSEVMLSSPNGVAGAIIEGIDRNTVEEVSEVGRKLVLGRLPIGGKKITEVTLGVEIARKLHVTVGDSVVLTIPFATSIGNDAPPLVRKLEVVGIVRVGMFEYDKKYGLIELSDLQNTLNIPRKVNAFKILTFDANQSMRTTMKLNDKYSYPLRARDWSSLNRNMFYAIRLEKVVIAIILLAIVLVAGFNVISTIIMIVQDKKRQISMLKALGFTPRQTFAVFLCLGGLMSALGAVLGVGLARALCAVLEWKSIIDLPAEIYMFGKLPVEIRTGEWVAIVVLTLLLALFCTLWPSLQISRKNAVEGLRYE